jgi:hypothetical protein
MRRISNGLMILLAATLVACGDGKGGGGDGAGTGETAGGTLTLEFRGTQAFLPGLSLDTGWLPEDSPAAVRATMTADGELVVVAGATTDGATMEGVAGSGELSVGGSLVLEVSARIDASGIEYEGVVESFEYAVDTAMTSFDPFAIGEPVEVAATLPAQVLGEVPIPSVPGASLRMEVTGGELTSAFEGACAEADGGFGQYTGTTTVAGTVACAATIVVEIPIVGTETFGPFAFDVPIPETTSALDLGTRSLSTGDEAPTMGTCEGAAQTSGAGTDGGDDTTSAATDGPSTTGPAGDSTEDGTGPSDDTTDSGPTADGDPDYPRPDETGCPGGGVAAMVGAEPPNAVCLPPCGEGDVCPNGATGTATGVCAVNPESSFLPCSTEVDCNLGESCISLTCVMEPPTHCVLACSVEVQCPDEMTCVVDVCTYL